MANTGAHLETALYPLAGPHLTIFVLIDALGWEIIKDRQFLDRELTVRKPLKTVLGFSSGAIPTILTGLPPAQTGHWNMYYYDPEGSPFRWLRLFSFLPERVLDNRYSRKLIKELGRHVLGMGPLFECNLSPLLLPRFNWVEKKNLYAEGGIPNAVSIFDLLKERRVPHRIYSYHSMSDERILEQARRDIRSTNSRFYFLYLSEMDHFLHSHCAERESVDRRLAWYDEQLRKLFDVALQRDPNAVFTITSDHGMTPVCSTYDLVAKIEARGYKMPEQYLSVYDSTMARYWFFDETARVDIVAELERTRCGRILSDRELTQLGVFFPDRRYGEVIFLLDPGWLFARSDFNGGRWNPIGMHGYHPSDSHSDAIFLSNRIPCHEMNTIADVYAQLEGAALGQ